MKYLYLLAVTLLLLDNMLMTCEADRVKRKPADPPMNKESCEIMCGLNCTLKCFGQLFDFCCKYLKSSTKTGSRRVLLPIDFVSMTQWKKREAKLRWTKSLV
ncbi:PREDICTED: uncharacterized protein LOC106122453 [Papilio xuthus]|uniref:Uncharacterized protein LOC106122453 n=1 Tax=Papilio xuthus TaxID=66420 RepID=A0AAJ7EEA7_PAPXU|nr:PREDICTED: uncharacterized protein LOC106122453 [Papilio xuthus]